MPILEDSGWTDSYGGVAVAIVAAVVLLGFLVSGRTHKKQRLPPGPRGWPILGALPFVGPLPHESFYELSKKYGPLMFISLGSVRTVIVTSPELAEAILKTHDQITCSRPVTAASSKLFYGGLDIGFSPYGHYWRYVRKVCTIRLLTHLRINQSREIREREVMDALRFIAEESKRGYPVNMAECLSMISMNNITEMTMNKSYCVRSYGSDGAGPAKVTSLQAPFQELFELLGKFNISDFVPILKPFDLQGFGKLYEDLYQRLDKFLEEIIEEHQQRTLERKSTVTPGNYKEDFVDALLGVGETHDFQEKLSMESVKANVVSILAAAADSSSVWAQWVLTELIRHPHMMKRVQEELHSVVGPHRLVREEDLPELKYLHAVLKEASRIHPTGPMMLPHQATEDFEVQGYNIPAGTRIMLNVWAIQRDPSVWERPLEFNPDRFLDLTDITGHNFQYLPFGSGRRMCPGFNLGWMMVVYPLAVLLHSLDFSLPEGQKPEEIDMSEVFGIALYKKVPLTVFGKARLANHVIHPAQPEEN